MPPDSRVRQSSPSSEYTSRRRRHRRLHLGCRHQKSSSAPPLVSHTRPSVFVLWLARRGNDCASAWQKGRCAWGVLVSLAWNPVDPRTARTFRSCRIGTSGEMPCAHCGSCDDCAGSYLFGIRARLTRKMGGQVRIGRATLMMGKKGNGKMEPPSSHFILGRSSAHSHESY